MPEQTQRQPTHSETGHSEGGHAKFPPFDFSNYPSQILWFAIAFGLFYALMSRVALPRMKQIIDARESKIEEDLAAARKMQEEARQAAISYEKTLAEARSRARDLAQETRSAVKLAQDKKRKELELDLDHKLMSAETQIAEMKAAAMTHVGQIANDAASAIVEHFTGKPVDATAIAAAIAEYRV